MAEEVVTFVTGNQKKLQEVISILGPQIGFSVSLTIVLESIFYNDKIKEDLLISEFLFCFRWKPRISIYPNIKVK